MDEGRPARRSFVMPTGTGKTFMAFLCIEKKSGVPRSSSRRRSTSWCSGARELEQSFGVEVGMVGGNEHSYKPLTVTTYDSAYIYLERWANQYGMIIFDECPTTARRRVQRAPRTASLAPFRPV